MTAMCRGGSALAGWFGFARSKIGVGLARRALFVGVVHDNTIPVSPQCFLLIILSPRHFEVLLISESCVEEQQPAIAT